METITPTQLASQAYRAIGVTAMGETPDSTQVTEAVTAANQIIDAWRTNNLTIPSSVREEFSLVAGQQNYTIGSGGDFDIERPVAIDAASILVNPATVFSVSSITRTSTTATVTTSSAHGYADGNSIAIAGAVQSAYNGTFTVNVTGNTTFTYTVAGSPTTPATGTITAQDAIGQAYEILMGQLNYDGYIGITIKGLDNPFPVNFYYDTTYTAGLGTIFVWPIPNQVYTIVLYISMPLASLNTSALTTAVYMPPGYVRALKYALAQELIPLNGKDQTTMAAQFVISLARESLADIKRQNQQITVQSTGLAAAMFGFPSGAYVWDWNRNIVTGP